MAAIVKFAAISIIAAALLAAACSDSGGSAEPSPSTTPPPQTSARLVYLGGRAGTLRICADLVPASESAAALTDSETAELKVNFDAAVLRGVNLNKDRIGGVPEEYAEVTFDIGCPAPRVFELALREGRMLDYRERTELVQENIAPSYADLNPYRFFLYLVEPAAYAAAFGDEPYAVSSEEFVCEGICMSVTEAVYVPTGAPSAHIEAGFLEVLSLLTGEQIRQQRADIAATATPIDTSAWPTYENPPCDFADPGGLRRGTSFNISGRDAYDTLVCGYLRLVDVPTTSYADAATLAYFVITDHADAEFIQAVDDLIQLGNTLNRMVDGHHEIRLGCFIDGEVRGSVVDSLTLDKLLDSSETNQVQLMLSFKEGGGVGGRCLSHADTVELR